MLAIAVASHAYEQRRPPLIRVSVDELLDGAGRGGDKPEGNRYGKSVRA
jgi:hypothetical protein